MKKNFFCLVLTLIATTAICLGASIKETQADSAYTDGYRVSVPEMINTHLDGAVNLSHEEKISSQPGSNNDVILFRVVRNCSDGRFHYGRETTFNPVVAEDGYVRYGQLNIYDLENFRSGVYRNYTCGNRYQQQCVNDGSFDTYYDELCIKRPDVKINDAIYSDNGDMEAEIEYKNIGDNDGLILYRATMSCSTGEPVGERSSDLVKKATGKYQLDYVQIFDLEKFSSGNYYDYTCGNHYQQQCVNDGSFDTYYEEVCVRVNSDENISAALDELTLVSGYSDNEPAELVVRNDNFNNPYDSNNSGIKNLIRTHYSNSSTYLNNGVAYQPSSNNDMTLFRVVRSCSTGEEYGTSYSARTEWKPGQWMVGYLQMLDLEEAENGYYRNYTCGNRYQEQCINDGSFDIYYEEFCSYGAN